MSNRLLLVALTYKKLRDVRIDSSPMEPEVYHKLCNSLSFVILNTLGSFIYPLKAYFGIKFYSHISRRADYKSCSVHIARVFSSVFILFCSHRS